jgi:predicted RNase H-like nuclease (RuvC/YqgF family)
MDPGLIVALSTAIVGPVLAFVVAWRKLSNSLKMTDAAQIRKEATDLRAEYRQEAIALREQVRLCNARIDLLEERNEALYLENGNLKRMIEGHEETISELRSLVHDLNDKNKLLESDNSRLQTAADVLKARVLELEEQYGEP